MKRKTIYYLPGFTLPVILSALFMVCSAVARIVWACGEPPLPRSFLCLQILLPLAANVSFVLILLRDGRDRLFRSAIPVWLGCVFFAVKALGFPSLVHTVLCLGLYALVAALYTATVTGRVPTQKPLWLLFGLPLLYHILVEDRQKAGWPLHDWLPEASVLLCMAALLCVSLAMKRRTAGEGEYVPGFGDRSDGRRLRKLSPIFAVSPYIMKTRNTSQNFIEDHIEVTAADRYIAEKRRAGMRNFGVLHVLLAAYVRVCARYPGLNRFIGKFNEKVQSVKDAPLDTGFDKLAGAFNLIPGLVLKFFVFLLQTLDYFGLLPRALTKLSPFHGSLYITSMASLGIPPIYHHLYDFGNVPVFCSFGRKRRVYETRRDGGAVLRKYIDCCFVTDERIVDGFYFASAMRYLHGLLDDPWQLDAPPEAVLRDQD